MKQIKLRWYQEAMNEPTRKFLNDVTAGQRGQVYAPTGSGKTVCFIELIRDLAAQGKKNIAILHPRIALSQDQLRRTSKALGVKKFHYTSFHSGGRYNIPDSTVQITSTTDAKELTRVIDQTIESKKVHITFSSYHSFDKIIAECGKFDLVICDEAHYLTQDKFYEYVANINANKILFYTATPITDVFETDFMKDLTVFGPVIAPVEPKALIKDGYIVAPLLHILECATFNKDAAAVDVVDVVAHAFVYQHREITGYGMPYAQMLVASRGLEDLRRLESELANLWIKIREHSDGKLGEVNLFTIDSTGSYLNGRQLESRDKALELIKSSNGNCIVAHYDTLSEGIDIDTLTGVVLMRNMSKAKVLQTIGRCARPFAGDLDENFEPRKDLYDPWQNIDNRSKRRCVVTIPVIDGEWIANNDSKRIAEAFIAGGYGDLLTYMSKSDSDNPRGKSKEDFEMPDDDNKFVSGVVSAKVTREIEELKALFDGLYN